MKLSEFAEASIIYRNNDGFDKKDILRYLVEIIKFWKD
jgi:hypothetical protein